MRRSRTRAALSKTSGPFRALSASVACFVVLSQLSAFLHFVVVSHDVCPEHRELVHSASGEGAAAAHSADPAAHARDDSVDTAESSRSPDTGHGHDHCIVCALRREHATLGRAASPVPPSLGPEPLLAGHASALIPSPIPLYLLAPKNSPPV